MEFRKNWTSGSVWLVATLLAVLAPVAGRAEQVTSADTVTFTKDIAPILQRSCQDCHRPNSVAPMSLLTYEEVRPWARAIKTRTSIGPKMGVMPPWYIEKNVGIHRFKNDPSLSEQELAKIARWVDSGAPRGNPADMPPPRQWADGAAWTIGHPDLVLSSAEIFVGAKAPDWWGDLEPVPTKLEEDRYVAAVEVKEVNDIPRGVAASTVGGRYVVHHANYISQRAGADGTTDVFNNETTTQWPVHEVGRNADVLEPKAGRLLQAGSQLVVRAHLHSNGRDTKSRLVFGFKFHPKGYKPTVRRGRQLGLGNGVDIDVKPLEGNQQHHAYMVLQEHAKLISFEPHLHAPGTRMCMEAIWGINIQTLVCAGYDHSWVRTYVYADDSAPLLPKGTILHLVGYMDNSLANKNVADPRNWQGAGNRSVANMFIDLGEMVTLTEEQFQEEMAVRREQHKGKDVILGCPLCFVAPAGQRVTDAASR